MCPCAVAQSFLKEKVRGNAERLKWQEMSRSRKMDSVLRKLFSGKGFAKPRLILFEFGRDFEFYSCGGRVWEGIRTKFFFGEAGTKRKTP